MFNLGDAHLGEQCRVVLDMPVVGYAALSDLQQVGRNEVDRLALGLGLAEGSGEVSRENHVHGYAITDYDHLPNLDAEIRNRRGMPLASTSSMAHRSGVAPAVT